MNNLSIKLKRNFTNVAGERLYIGEVVNIKDIEVITTKDIFTKEEKTILKCVIEKDGIEIIVNMKYLL